MSIKARKPDCKTCPSGRLKNRFGARIMGKNDKQKEASHALHHHPGRQAGQQRFFHHDRPDRRRPFRCEKAHRPGARQPEKDLHRRHLPPDRAPARKGPPVHHLPQRGPQEGGRMGGHGHQRRQRGHDRHGDHHLQPPGPVGGPPGRLQKGPEAGRKGRARRHRRGGHPAAGAALHPHRPGGGAPAGGPAGGVRHL